MTKAESPSYSDAVTLVHKYLPAIENLVLSIVDDIYTEVPLEANFKRLGPGYNRTEFYQTWSTLVGSALIELIYLGLMEEGLKASFKYGKEFMKGE